MRLKSVAAAGLCAAVLLSSTPAFAASVGSISTDKNVGYDESYGVSTEYEDVQLGQNAETDVYLTVNGDGAVAGVPTRVILDGKHNTDGKNTGEYGISVSGDIAGDEVLQVYPRETNIKMQQAGKGDVDAVITQNKTEFTANEISNDASTTGKIESEALSAGAWNSKFDWIITMKNEFVYYSTIEKAAQDASALTTENADVTRKDVANAEAAVVIKDDTARVYLMKDASDVQSLTFAENTYFDLSGYTIDFAENCCIRGNSDFSVLNGNIYSHNTGGIVVDSIDANVNMQNINIHTDISATVSRNVKSFEFNSATANIIDCSVVMRGTGSSSYSAMGGSVINGDAINVIDNLSVNISVSNVLRARGIQIRTSDTEFNDCNFNVIYADNDTYFGCYCMYVAEGGSGTVRINGGNYFAPGKVFKTIADDSIGNAFTVDGGRIEFQNGDSDLYVHGGNNAVSVQGISDVTIKSGTFCSPNHGGMYEDGAIGSVVNISGGRFYNTQTAGEETVLGVYPFGGIYFGGNSVVHIKNAIIEGGQYGLRIKNDYNVAHPDSPFIGADVTVTNCSVSGVEYAFSTGEGKLTLNKGVTTDYSIMEIRPGNGILVDNR